MSLELGPQPLDEVMKRLGLTAANVVSASTQQLSFKMLQKGRKGRRLTPNIKRKILNAIQAASAARPSVEDTDGSSSALPPAESLTLKDLFNY